MWKSLRRGDEGSSRLRDAANPTASRQGSGRRERSIKGPAGPAAAGEARSEAAMNPTQIPDHLMDDVIPLAFVAMLSALVVLPAITFGIARKWSASQPQSAGAVLTGAVLVCVVGILSATFLALVVLRWFPPLDTLLHGS
jgi:hypothetical protein